MPRVGVHQKGSLRGVKYAEREDPYVCKLDKDLDQDVGPRIFSIMGLVQTRIDVSNRNRLL